MNHYLNQTGDMELFDGRRLFADAEFLDRLLAERAVLGAFLSRIGGGRGNRWRIFAAAAIFDMSLVSVMRTERRIIL